MEREGDHLIKRGSVEDLLAHLIYPNPQSPEFLDAINSKQRYMYLIKEPQSK